MSEIIFKSVLNRFNLHAAWATGTPNEYWVGRKERIVSFIRRRDSFRCACRISTDGDSMTIIHSSIVKPRVTTVYFSDPDFYDKVRDAIFEPTLFGRFLDFAINGVRVVYTSYGSSLNSNHHIFNLWGK